MSTLRWGNSPAHDLPVIAIPFYCCITGICKSNQVTKLHQTVDVLCRWAVWQNLEAHAMPRAMCHVPNAATPKQFVHPCTGDHMELLLPVNSNKVTLTSKSV